MRPGCWSTTPPTQPYTGAVGVVASTDPAVANIGCRPLPQRSQCPEMDRGAHLLTSTTTISIKGAMAKLHKLWGSVCKCMLATYTVYVAHKGDHGPLFQHPRNTARGNGLDVLGLGCALEV